MIIGALVGYHYFFNREEPSATRRLSIFIDEHIDEVLAPLPLGTKGRLDIPPHKHDILILQQDIRDLHATAPPQARLAVSTAVKLCETVLKTTIIKEQHIARINDSRSKNWLSPLDRDPIRQAAERQHFFEDAIAQSWNREAAKSRLLIDKQYEQLREAER